MRLTDNWKDEKLYYAVIKTNFGKLNRVFAFDVHLTEEECANRLMESLPGVLSIESFDDWGPVLSYKTKQEPNPAFLASIEEKFKKILTDSQPDQADALRDLITDMEIGYADTVFSETIEKEGAPENLLYSQLQAARDNALILLNKSTQT